MTSLSHSVLNAPSNNRTVSVLMHLSLLIDDFHVYMVDKCKKYIVYTLRVKQDRFDMISIILP